MKNIIKRTISALSCMLVLGTMAAAPAYAAGETLTLTSAQGMPGDTVTLNVEVGCNNNFESLDVVVTWEDKALKAAQAKPVGKAMGASDAGDGYCTVVIYGAEALPDGAVATIDFTIPSDAQTGKVYDLSVSTVNTFAIFDGPDIPDTVKVQSGKITVGEGGNTNNAEANSDSNSDSNSSDNNESSISESDDSSNAQTVTEAVTTAVTEPVTEESTEVSTEQITEETTVVTTKAALTQKDSGSTSAKKSSDALGALMIAEIIAFSIIGYFGIGIALGMLTKSMNTKKGYKGGFLWGFLLSVIGVVIVAVRKPKNAVDAQAENSGDNTEEKPKE